MNKRISMIETFSAACCQLLDKMYMNYLSILFGIDKYTQMSTYCMNPEITFDYKI